MDARSEGLQNSLILESIFLQSNFSGQKEFRVVSKIWRNSSLQKWRKSVVIQIDLDEGEALKTKHGLEDFLKLCEVGKEEAYRISELPFQRFRLFGRESRVTIDTDNYGNPIQRLIQGIHSPAIKYLELNGVHSTKTLIETLKWILREGCVSLIEFKVVNCFFSNYKEDGLEKVKPATEEAKLSRGNQFKNLTLLDPRFFVSNSKKGSIYVVRDIPSCDIKELCDIAPNLKVIGYDHQDTKKVLAAMPDSRRRSIKMVKVECTCLK